MTDLDEFRKMKDMFLKTDPHSPLSLEQKASFEGLDYYPENATLRFKAEVETFEGHQHVQMQTSTGDIEDYLKYGKFQFEVDGAPAELTVYQSEDGGAFVPFVDATSGKETYGAGRYLEIEPFGDNKFQVDFNLAYNPWCAYSLDYSCPLPPQENRLSVPIRAGEKNFPS